jgi:hypothetical protein
MKGAYAICGESFTIRYRALRAVCMIRAITTAIVAIFSAGALLHLVQAQFQVGTKKSVSLTGVNIAGADFGEST